MSNSNLNKNHRERESKEMEHQNEEANIEDQDYEEERHIDEMNEDEIPYVALFSVHGLIRGRSPELGRDLDTGGQVTYVLELARALSVYAQVDLFTRLVDDSDVSKEYAQPEEDLTENKRAKIIRIPCGPKKYIRKELLWPFLPELVDGALEFILTHRKKPYVVHGHYADGSLVAAQLGDILGVPMAITGHSMGRTKLKQLLKGGMPYTKIQDSYFIDTRIEAEERSLLSTNLVIANSREEIITQWRSLYNSFYPLEQKSLWKPVTLKPGVGMKCFEWDRNEKTTPKIWKVIDKFLDNPNKPVILLLARPAPEKNLTTMVEAFGECEELQEKANLVIIAGKRDNKSKLEASQREVLQQISDFIDKYNLSRKVAYPETHERDDVPALFALPAYRGGVFANIALREPFGLTLIEAAVNGSPLIATRNGAGPEIVKMLDNGIDVDPTNKKEICQAILKIIDNKELWQQYHENSIKNSTIYSWDGHVNRYMKCLRECQEKVNVPSVFEQRDFNLLRKLKENEKLLIVDIDNTLLGSTEEAVKAFKNFIEIFRKTPHLKLAVATGRSINSAIEYLSMFDNKLVHELEFLITSCGTEIHYFQNKKIKLLSNDNKNKEKDYVEIKTLISDDLYHQHLNYRFFRNKILSFIENDFPELEMQSEKTGHSLLEQRYYKLSYCFYEDRTLKNREGVASSNKSSRYTQGNDFDDEEEHEEEEKEKLSSDESPPNSPLNKNVVNNNLLSPSLQNTPVQAISQTKASNLSPMSPPTSNNTMDNNEQNVDEHEGNNDLVILEDMNNVNNDVNIDSHNDVNIGNNDDNNENNDNDDNNDDAMSIRAPSVLSLSSSDSYMLPASGSSMALARLGLNPNLSVSSLQNYASYPSFSHLHTASLGNNMNNNSNTLNSHDLTLKNINKSLSHVNMSHSPNATSEKRAKISHKNPDSHGKQKSENELREALRRKGYPCEVIISHSKFVDILPIRASKGKAIRYLMARNNIKFNQVITAGDSGNDYDMLSGLNRAILVGNYQQEDLKPLKHNNHVYFAHDKYANGIVEGLKHYHII